MPFNGLGVYSPPSLPGSWSPAISGQPATPADWNTLLTDISTALSTTITSDGQSTVTADIPFGGFRLTNVGAATMATDAPNAVQVQNGLGYAADTGIADAYAIAPAPAIAAYVVGQIFGTKITHTNATTTPTLAVSGLTSGLIKWPNGSAPAIGDILLDAEMQFMVASVTTGTPVFHIQTGSSPFTGGNLTSAINEAKGADIASATTTNIGAATGNFVHVTGTTTITGLGTIQAGTRRIVEFDGVLILTHNATSLILPGAANITTGAGDVATFVSEGSGNWRCVDYIRATGAALAGPGLMRRQTVAGPVNTSGFPSLLPSTDANLNLDSQNITASAPFIAAAANGWSAVSGGPVDRVGFSVANLIWSSLTASRAAATPNYLYVTVNADGTLTTGSTLVAPVYQFGGTPAVTSGLFTFNIAEMKGYLGNGATAPQVYVVFVGEAATDGTGVISTVAYAYNGRYENAFTATLPGVGVTVSANHNIGVKPQIATFLIECTTIDAGYAVGEQIINPGVDNAGITYQSPPHCTAKVMARTSGSGSTGTSLISATTGAPTPATAANWKYKSIAQRGW
ncbi:hypothetical protein UFOVP833_48 [uncultured Caudovirales phage]|uniref:Uncharacterized protein n=1 Tax=uncultured Caudovirales phage TaxID=2100421 RepID=A0A6J5SVE0_9CAUD|nr:hypothetical protein UFOVP833_48 [uncultured Caudovirales phage]CAB4218571.1 hypothetical protein UFOVP1603_40 [uncultured Caudovirales phage]